MSIRILLIALTFIGCTTKYELNEAEVTRVLQTLSADDMQGRKTGSDGINKAANFIIEEFKKANLQTLDGLSSFKQSFNMVSSSISKTSRVVLNDYLHPDSTYFIRLADESISWSGDDTPNIMYINIDDNFREKIGEALSSETNLIVIVSDKHEDIFSRYQGYYSRAKLSFTSENTNKANIAVVISANTEINSLDIRALQENEEKELSNIVGKIEGRRANEYVLFSAHYDHIGTGSVSDGDSIYNGANDDASGVTAVIELAKYFSSREQPERTLIFATFTAEEIGGFGSKYFSEQLNADEIMAMLNIEMIGKESKEGLNSAWMTGWEKSDLGELLQKNLKEVDFKFFEDPYPKQNLFYRSDNATLAKLGVPAHSISTTQIDIDQDYHQLSDEFETLDVTNITNTIKAIAIGSQAIIDGKQTPSRVNPDDVKN